MPTRQKWILAIFFAYFSAYWAASSPQVRFLSSYAYEEPHAMAPTWEAAARAELITRCANNFAMGISVCSSFGAVIDSLPIRLVAAITGRSAPTQQTEWVDPWLQWTLVVKHGVFSVILLFAGFFLLRNILENNFWYPLLFLLALSGNKEFASNAFFVRPDGEMGGAILFLFLLAWQQLLLGSIRAYWPGVVAGILAPIKLPVVAVAALAVRHRKAALAFVLVAGFLMLGLVRTSYEVLSYPRNAILSANLGGLGAIGYTQTHVSPLQILWLNLQTFTAGQIWFIPLALLAWTHTFLSVCRQRKASAYLYFAALTLLLMVPLKTQNGQARFLVGFTAIYFALVAAGLYRLFPRRGSLFCIAAGAICLAQQFPHWKYIPSTFRPEHHLHANEQTLLSILQVRDVYLDERLLFNVDREPFAPYREKIKLVDPLSGDLKIPAGSVLVAHCYPWSKAAELGVSKPKLGKDCAPEKQISLSTLSVANNRLRPDFTNTNLAIFTPEIELSVPPIRMTKGELRLASSYFRPTGYFVKNYFSQISNQEAFPGAPAPTLEKSVEFTQRGAYLVRPEITSRYRDERSKLVLLVNDREASACSLDTSKDVVYPRILPRFLHKAWAGWRAVFLPKHCVLPFSLAQTGPHKLSLRIDSPEARGQLSFFDIVVAKQ